MPALNLTAVIIVFGIGFLRLVYRLGKLAKHKWFAKRFGAKFIQLLNNKDYDDKSYQWLLRNLFQLKTEMKEHGDNNFLYIGNIITNLHDSYAIPPNFPPVGVCLDKYIGRLGYSIRKLLIYLIPVLWPIQFVEFVVDMILRFGKIARVISTNDSNSYSGHPVTLVIKMIFAAYAVIAGWDAVVKKLKGFL